MATLTWLLLIPPFGVGHGANAATSATSVPSSGLGGTAGTVVSLPTTPSAVTVSGHGAFSNLKLTVNQTQDLVHQSVLLSWSGGVPSSVDPSGNVLDNFMQVMQCWGDDGTGTGPPPEHCEFGAEASAIVGTPPEAQVNPNAYPVPNWTQAVTRILALPGQTCGAGAYAGCQSYDALVQLAATAPDKAFVNDAENGYVLDPFKPVSGDVVPVTSDETCCIQPPPWTSSWDQNPWFNHASSNELDIARTYPDGTGQALFQTDTANEAPGLGCGQAQSNPNGTVGDPPKCWLVVVPRGSPVAENPTGQDSAGHYINTSPLSPGVWSNRVAIPIGFQPVGTGCAAGATVRRVLGGELAQAAVHSWQPALCNTQTSSAYLYTGVSEDSARTSILSPATDVIGGAVTFPVDPKYVSPTNPLVYAPLTLSGVVIAFNIQRQPLDPHTGEVPPDEVNFVGRPVTKLNLTPRLVAKLLTESYQDSFGPGSIPASDLSTWAKANPTTLFRDPDFRQFNPEFAELTSQYNDDASQLVVSEPLSDAATLVWEWITSDPAAKAWLGGQPDPWGMRVNPYYSSDGSANPLGAFTPPVDTYPKNDPYCFVPSGPIYQLASGGEARPLCQQDWAPYTNSMSGTSAAVSTANSGAHTTFNPVALTANNAWSADGPQAFQRHSIFGITTTDQAARYGVTVAAVSQAGDDGSSPTFISPDTAGLAAGESAMTASAAGVRLPDPATSATGAYPLSTLTYAALSPVTLDASARAATAAFLNYAAGPGQTPGYALGSLPLGYAPLPSELTAQTATAAATVLDPSSLLPSTTTTTMASASAPAGASTTTQPQPASSTTVPGETGSGKAPGGSSGSGATSAAPAFPATGPRVSRDGGGSVVGSSPPPPILTTPTTTLRPSHVSSRGRTPGSKTGAARYAVMMALLVGLASAVSSQLLLKRQEPGVGSPG